MGLTTRARMYYANRKKKKIKILDEEPKEMRPMSGDKEAIIPLEELQFGETLPEKINIIWTGEKSPEDAAIDWMNKGRELTLKELDKGKKFDDGKLRWDLLPYDVIEDVVDILTYGANKYGDNNWQKVDTDRYVAALWRHFAAWRTGEELDKESGKHHLAHALCNLMFINWQEKHKGD